MNPLTALLLERTARWVCGRDLWDAAQTWVALYECKDLTGAEKRDRVLAALQKEFVALAASLAGFAIEAAVQFLRRRAP